MNNIVTHFEIPADDPTRAKKFYETVFGWKIEYMKDYDYYSVKAKDAKGQGIDGGMMKRKMPDQLFTNYITVTSIDAMLKKIKASGGKICMEKQSIGEMGAIAGFLDTENNFIGLHEMGKMK